MDMAWKHRNSLMEPFVLLAARPDGSVTKWSSVNPSLLTSVTLNDKNQFMAIDSSLVSRQFVAAGSLPQIELYDLQDSRLI